MLSSRAGYADTVWPSEHTDRWRTHTAQNVGLPANFSPDQLQVEQVAADIPVWGYTLPDNTLWATAGSPFFLDMFTKLILTKKATRPNLRQYLGHKPQVVRYSPSNHKLDTLNLPTKFIANYTGGLLIHQNGYVYSVAESILTKIDPTSFQIVAQLTLPHVKGTPLSQFLTSYNGLQVLQNGNLLLKGTQLGSSKHWGWLLLIEPENLQIVCQTQAPVGSARLTLATGEDNQEYLYHVNATKSIRFCISANTIERDPNWGAIYREPKDGSTDASSPVFMGDAIVFTDNTLPRATAPMKIYVHPLNSAIDRLTGTLAFSGNQPGANFFMVLGDPFVQKIVAVCDQVRGRIAVHRLLPNFCLEPLWEKAYATSASPIYVADRDLLYINDFQNGTDNLVILQGTTGKELGRVKLAAHKPTIGTIVPGAAEDIYVLSTEIGEKTGLISRISLK